MCPLASVAAAVNWARAVPPDDVTEPSLVCRPRSPSWAAYCRSGPARPPRGTFTLTLSMAG